jgi:DHA2 family multidrug resistance protein
VLLEEGQREQWFSSDLIRYMAMVSGFGFLCIAYGQIYARRPVIKLRLLADRQFGAVALMGIVLGMVLYGTSYVIPQFLATIAGYNSYQSGQIVLLSGLPSLAMMAIVPILLKRIDVRVAVASGLCIMGASALIDSSLTAGSDGSDFVASQLMRGVGQILGMLFLSQACVRSVSREDSGDASGLFNAFRNLGAALPSPGSPPFRTSASGCIRGGWRSSSTPTPIWCRPRWPHWAGCTAPRPGSRPISPSRRW